MSTKTLRKRIALVAVSAMGAAVLSVAPAHAGPVAAGNLTFDAVGVQPAVCYVNNTTKVATVVTGQKVKLTLANSVDTSYVALTGLTVDSSGGAWDTVTLTTVEDAGSSSSNVLTLKAGSIGTGTISLSATSSSSPVDVLTVNIVAACGGGAFDAASSYVAVVNSAQAQDNAAVSSNTDSTTGVTVANAGSGYISIALADAYGAALSSGALIATVTSGDAYVNAANETTSLPAKGTAKTAVLATTGAKALVRVDQATANAPTNATVQISFGGTVVATKSIKFYGAAASIKVSDETIGLVGTGGYFRYQVLDAAGNALPSVSIADDATANASNTVAGALNITGTTGSLGELTPAVNQTNITAGTVARFSCVKAGTGTLNVKYVNNAASIVKKAITVACSGALDTWTVKMDKATYAPGEIATLTITGKDADGFLVYGNKAPTGIAATLGGMEIVTAVDATNDRFQSGPGQLSYQFKVGVTEGSYVGVVKVTGDTDTANKTVQYKIASAGGSVTNAEVLKAIVSLIASINKQIAALQKALLKK